MSGGRNPRQLDHPGTPQVLIRSGVDVYFAGEALLAESRAQFCRSSLPLFLTRFLFLSSSLPPSLSLSLSLSLCLSVARRQAL